MESQSLSQACHCLLNNDPDEVNLKTVLPTVWLIKLNILLGFGYLLNICFGLHYICSLVDDVGDGGEVGGVDVDGGGGNVKPTTTFDATPLLGALEQRYRWQQRGQS